MPNLFNLLTNAKNKIRNTGANLFGRLTDSGEAPVIESVQLDDRGNIDSAKALEIELNSKPLTLAEKLTGRRQEADIQKINPETGKGELVTVVNNRPGLFDDISAGYRENRSTPIAQGNFLQNTTPDGRNKGFGYRLGEAFGTAGRLLESPLGRSLLVGGIVGATGGNALEALTYGASTGMNNQANRMRDAVYRNELLSQAQENLNNRTDLTDDEKAAQLANISDQINNYRGYMDSTTYRNMLEGQQLRDNAAYRKMYFDTQQANQEAEREWRRYQAERQQRQEEIDNQIEWTKLRQQAQDNAADREVTLRGQDLNYAAKQDAVEEKRENTLKEVRASLNMIDIINQQIDKFPKATGLQVGFNPLANKMASYKRGPEGGGEITTRALIDNVKAQVIKMLTGAGMTNEERRSYEKFLPTTKDNPVEIKAKLDGLKLKITTDPRLYGYTPNKSSSSGYQTIGKYKVRVK